MKKFFIPGLLPHKDIKWGPLIPLIGAANKALAITMERSTSKFAVLMLDILFVRPVIRSSEFAEHKAMQSKPMMR